MSIKDFFRDEWAGVAAAWARWGPQVERQGAAATDWLLELGGVRPGMAVLDLAGGTGDPALALARRVGPTGTVVATDLVAGALEMAGRAAATAGLTNVVTQVADMEALPFSDARFDVVTCRLGLVFCADPAKALAEARRVLRPGGRAAFVAWGAPTQPLFQATLGQLHRALAPGIRAEIGALSLEESRPEAGTPDEPVAAPGPFRFAAPADLARTLIAAGFEGVSAEERTVPWPFAGSGAAWWRMFVDLGGSALRRQLEALDAPARRALDARIAAALDAHRRGGVMDATALLVGAAGSSPAFDKVAA